jgi:hypothetical protein
MCKAIMRSSAPSASRRTTRVARTADQVVPWGEPESEGWRVARGQRHRRDHRERPRETGSLRRRRRAPGALVDQQDVGSLRFDRCLQIGDLEAGALAELAQPGPERPEASPGTPVLGLEALDLGRERLGGETGRAHALQLVQAAAQRYTVATAEQLEQRRHQRVQAAGHGVHIGEHGGHRLVSVGPSLVRC